MRGAWLVLALVSCTSHNDDHKTATLDDLAYHVPADWTEHGGAKLPGVTTAVWTPQENPNKESVEIIRSDARRDAPVDATQLGDLLVAAQRSLPQGHTSPSKTFTTAGGGIGVELETDFVPPGLHRTYHRVHAVFVDRGVVVHVLYTAATPDSARKAFDTILHSIHREEA